MATYRKRECVIIYENWKMLNGKIHTIVTDLDGTFLSEHSQISELNHRVFQKALNEGLNIVFATGRRFYSTYRFATEFEGSFPLICNNGQLMRMYPGQERVLQYYLEPDLVYGILNLNQEFQFSFLMHTDRYEEGIDFIVQSRDESLHSIYTGNYNRSVRLGQEFQVGDFDRITVLCFFDESIQNLARLEREIFRVYSNHNIRCVTTTIRGIGPCMEVITLGSSKWSALNVFLNNQGLNSEGVIAFGDEANDLELIESSGFGVAMKNAIPILKERADYCSPYTNKEDGVGRVILELGIISL